MGKFSLFLAIGAFIVGSYYVLGVNDTVVDNQQQVSTHTYRTLAREVALTGFGIADKGLKEAIEDYGNPSRSFSGSYNGGTYTVSVTNPPLVGAGPVMSTIEVVGEVQGESYRIQATYEKKLSTGSGEGGGGLPKFMHYGLISEESLIFNGGTSIYDDGVVEANANVHTNGSLTIHGKGAVKGFGTYSGHGGDDRMKREAAEKFQPVLSPDGSRPYDSNIDPLSYHHTPRVDIPAFSASDYEHIADVHYGNGNVILQNESIQGGTAEAPRIIYVGGELQIKNNVQISGHVVFAVKRSIVVNGSFRNYDASGPLSTIAFYSGSHVTFNGSSTIHGQILTSDFIMNGSSTLYGSVASTGKITFNGSSKIVYRQSNPSLTEPFWPGEETAGEPVIVLADFREHNVL